MSITFEPLRQEYYEVPNKLFNPREPIDIIYNPLTTQQSLYISCNFSNVNALALLREMGITPTPDNPQDSGFIQPEKFNEIITRLQKRETEVTDSFKLKIRALLDLLYLCRHLKQSITWG
jgi:hypothetical protein